MMAGLARRFARINDLDNEAFSLLEILLAAIIFLISVAGIFATMNAVRGPVANKENQLAASVFGKQVLEALYSQVSDGGTFYTGCAGGANPCTDFDLSVGPHQVPPGKLPAGLTWPTILKISNTCAGVPNSCLIYNVTCANGSLLSNCSNLAHPLGDFTSAHQVALNINWPNVP